MTPRIALKIAFDWEIWFNQSMAKLELVFALKFALACGADCTVSLVKISCRMVRLYRLNYSPDALVQTTLMRNLLRR
jgi:hypothetical protein